MALLSTTLSYAEIGDAGDGDVQTGPFGSQLHASDYVPVVVPSIMPQDLKDDRVSTESIARIREEDAGRLAPGQHRLWGGFGGGRDFKNQAFPLRSGAPVRIAAVGGHQQRATRTQGHVHRELIQGGDDFRLRHITGIGFHEFGAPDFAAGLAGDQRIARPPGRSEGLAAIDRIVEPQAAGGLMLRAVIKDTGFIQHVGKVLRVLRREAVMAAFPDQQQFVKRIAVGQPGGPFLVGAEEIALGIEPQADGPATFPKAAHSSSGRPTARWKCPLRRRAPCAIWRSAPRRDDDDPDLLHPDRGFPRRAGPIEVRGRAEMKRLAEIEWARGPAMMVSG